MNRASQQLLHPKSLSPVASVEHPPSRCRSPPVRVSVPRLGETGVELCKLRLSPSMAQQTHIKTSIDYRLLEEEHLMLV